MPATIQDVRYTTENQADKSLWPLIKQASGFKYKQTYRKTYPKVFTLIILCSRMK